MVAMKYAPPKSATETKRIMATVLWIGKKNITRPMLNRNTERWRSVGAVSTAWCMAYLRVPRNKYERTRARLLGRLGIWGSWRYLLTHCCVIVANRADVVLSIRLSSHKQFTQIMDALGEDDGYDCGWTTVPFAEPESCWDICPRRNTVWSPESGVNFL